MHALVAAAHDQAPAWGQRASRLEEAAVADEVEERPLALFPEAAGEHLLPASQEVGLPEGGEKAAASEAEAREGGERPVHPEQVSPGDLQAPAQQVVFGVTDAVGDGGEGRLLGGDEQRALARAVGIDLGDAHPLEKAERPQPPLRLDDLLLAERASLLHRHLPPDDLLLRPLQAGDDDVVDAEPRACDHVQDDIRLLAVFGQGRLRLDLDLGVARVTVGDEQRVAVAREVANAVRDPHADGQLSGGIVGGKGHGRVHPDGGDEGSRPGLRVEHDGHRAAALRRRRLHARRGMTRVLQGAGKPARVFRRVRVAQRPAGGGGQARPLDVAHVGIDADRSDLGQCPRPDLVDHHLAGSAGLLAPRDGCVAITLAVERLLEDVDRLLEGVGLEAPVTQQPLDGGAKAVADAGALELDPGEGAGLRAEQQRHARRRRIVGLFQLHLRPPMAGMDELPPHRLRGRLGALAAEDVARRRPDPGPQGAIQGTPAFDVSRSHPGPRPRAHREDRIGAAGRAADGARDLRLEVAAGGQGEGDVLRRALQPDAPQRLPRPQARDAGQIAGGDHARPLDEDREKAGSGDGPEDDVEAGGVGLGLHDHVLVFAGGVEQLHHVSDHVGAEGLPHLHLDVAREPLDVRGGGGDAHRGHHVAGDGAAGSGEGGEQQGGGERAHRRVWRTLTSKP